MIVPYWSDICVESPTLDFWGKSFCRMSTCKKHRLRKQSETNPNIMTITNRHFRLFLIGAKSQTIAWTLSSDLLYRPSSKWFFHHPPPPGFEHGVGRSEECWSYLISYFILVFTSTRAFCREVKWSFFKMKNVLEWWGCVMRLDKWFFTV